jgi:hypothetical protein
MNANMIALKEQAISNRRGDYFMSGAIAQTAIGKVVCFVDFKKRNRNSLENHVCTRFQLNGKPIKAEELKKIWN